MKKFLHGLVGAAFMLTPIAWGQQPPPNAARVRKQAIERWQDERFGMFVHWGVYAVPAGIHNGKPVRHLGEWIMHHGRIPKDDYRKYAERFTAENYEPAEWVRLAKEAGMSYMVVTAKHHDGFALYDTSASDWDAVDASGAKRDLLKPLAEECRKQGMPLGYHYSQALDWWHPGGGKYGQAWDPAQEGDFDAYLSAVAIPQIRELVKDYGPVHCFFFDTPANMNAERAQRIEAVLPPSVLTNDRLAPGAPGGFRSYEGQLPQEFFPPGHWELCISINDTWGYKSSDHNWKSAASLKRTLAETASRGGNMLLNVGPDASGEIPPPALAVLKEIGGWMSRNGESIRGTRRSAYNPIPWNGGCTTRILPEGGTVLYAHLYERSSDGHLLLPGLTNPVVSAEILGGENLEFSRQGNSWRVKLPEFSEKEMPVVRIVLEGKPLIQAPSLAPDSSGKLELAASVAILKGQEIRVERQPDSLEQNIGFWTRKEDAATWGLDLREGGNFATEWYMACAPDDAGSVLAIMAEGKELGRIEVPSTGGWGSFRRIPGPPIALPPGTTTLSIEPLSKPGYGIVNLRSISLSRQQQ